MTASKTSTDKVFGQLSDTDGILQADIHVSDDTATTCIKIDRFDATQALDGIEIEVLEEHDHEDLISAKAPP